jgi:hypothetical protein
VADRWPDDLDPVEWAGWFADSVGAQAQPVDGQAALMEIGAIRLESLFPGDSAEDDPFDNGIGNFEDWSIHDTMRVLRLSRHQIGGWLDPAAPAVKDVARACGRQPAEVLAFAQHLAKCDLGMGAPSDVVRDVLREFGPDHPEHLDSRLAMIDAFGRQVIDDDEDAEGLLDLVEPPLDLEPITRPVAADGGPDPLSELNKLLPGGRGTRGRPPIVYTETLLESQLLSTLRQSPPTLVVLSGNAGDGKTAFLESVLVSAGEDIRSGRNEYSTRVGNGPYAVVLDGSEDAVGRSNSDLLHDVLGGFAGDQATHPARGTLIAVNKGRLLEFLETNRQDFAYLWRVVSSTYLGAVDVVDSPYVLIDLNERSGLAPDSEMSIFGGIVRNLANWDAWESECGRCPASSACPVRSNAIHLRSPIVRRQMWTALTAADLDDRIHVTTRHLVTRVASAVTSGLRCADIRSVVADSGKFPLTTFLYSSLFAQSSDAASAEADAMHRVMSSYDPADRGSPRRDRVLAHHLSRGAADDLIAALDGPDHDSIVAESEDLAAVSIDEGPSPGELEFRQRVLLLTRHVSRRLYLLDPDHELAPGAAVRTQAEFLAVTVGIQEPVVIRERILRALNSTLGIDAQRFEDLLAPRDYSHGLRGTGFAALIPRDRFRISLGDGLGREYRTSPFMESWPRSLRLEAHDIDGSPVAEIAVPLLMFEILMRADRGFRPTSQTERNYLIRLDRFYRDLAEHAWSEKPAYALYENGRVRARATLSSSHIAFAEA